MSGTAERLMDLAEAHIRDRGYAGFSFRDLAAEVGIKSASVHHHFPTKAKMAAVVANATRSDSSRLSRQNPMRALRMRSAPIVQRSERRSSTTGACASAAFLAPRPAR